MPRLTRRLGAGAAMGILLAGVPAVRAQEAPPAAVAPAAIVPEDTSTPRGALKVLTRALDAGDAAAARGVLLAGDPAQESWAEVMFKLAGATAEVRKQAVTRFGEEGAKAVIGDTPAAAAAALASIDRSTEELDGETATVRSSDTGEEPIRLQRVNGQWKVPLAAFVGGASAEQLQEVSGKMSRQADAMLRFAAELAEGKHVSAEAAAQALQLSQVEALFGNPATRPSSRPADPG